jgi:hypothetical protein
MTLHTAEACALGLTEEQLSGWRDGLLPPSEMARIAGHAATCQACQQRLDDLERIGSALRSQRAPDLRRQVWRGLQPRLNEKGRSAMSGRARALWGSGAAVAAAVVLVVLFASLLARRGSVPPGSGTPGATATTGAATPSPTPSQTADGLPQGWTAAQGIENGFGPAVAFAPSSPGTGYAYQQTNGTITVSVSHDSGATWQKLDTPTNNQDRCDLSVDPTDARDVLLVCTPAASSGFTALRSFDGGATWTKPQIQMTVNCFGGSGWAGSTPLLSFMLCDAASSQTQIVASVNRGPFTRLDTNGQLGGHDLGMIPFLGGTATAMYVQTGIMQFDQTGGQMNETTLRSTNGGATWASVTFSDGGTRVHLLTTTPDGSTLVGVYDNAPTQLGLSKDNGLTWQKLPAGPSGVPSFNDLLVAPDGTIVAASSRLGIVNNPDNRLFVLRSGASTWSVPFSLPTNAFPRALAVDASGHPTALWAVYAFDDRGSAWTLISHPL